MANHIIKLLVDYGIDDIETYNWTRCGRYILNEYIKRKKCIEKYTNLKQKTLKHIFTNFNTFYYLWLIAMSGKMFGKISKSKQQMLPKEIILNIGGELFI